MSSAAHHEPTKEAFADRGELSREDVAILAERTARQLLDVSLEEALAKLDRGELDGTAAESSLRALRFLIEAE